MEVKKQLNSKVSKSIIFKQSDFSFFFLKINLIQKKNSFTKKNFSSNSSLSLIFLNEKNFRRKKISENLKKNEIYENLDISFFNFITNREIFDLENICFDNLKKFFEFLYFDGFFQIDLLIKLNNIERIILLKFLQNQKNLKNSKNENFSKNGKYFKNPNFHNFLKIPFKKIIELSKKIFLGIEKRYKGYKVTNNKRFIFRKIKDIIFKKKKKSKKKNLGEI